MPHKKLLVLCLLLCLTGRLQAETPDAYSQALGTVQSALQNEAQAADAEEVPTGDSASLVAKRLVGPIHSVTAPGQPPHLISSANLIADIAAAEAVKDAEARKTALQAVSAQITLLRGSLDTGRSAVSAADVRQSVRQTLARPEFASDPPPPPSFTDKIAAWIDRMLSRRQPSQPANVPNVNPRIIFWVLVIVAAAAFAVLVAVLVQTITRREARAKPLELDAAEVTLMEARDNDSLLALAEQQAKAGDYRRAFRLVYLAALVALDTGGVLRFDRSKTNWEYLRALRAAGRGDIYSALTPLTREFDQVWYGLGLADAGRYARARAQYDALLSVDKPAAPEAAPPCVMDASFWQSAFCCCSFWQAAFFWADAAARPPVRRARKCRQTPLSAMIAVRAAKACLNGLPGRAISPSPGGSRGSSSLTVGTAREKTAFSCPLIRAWTPPVFR